jgi:hypothetical protein
MGVKMGVKPASGHRPEMGNAHRPRYKTHSRKNLSLRKITGTLNEKMLHQMYANTLKSYIKKKHGTTEVKLNGTNLHDLHFYL